MATPICIQPHCLLKTAGNLDELIPELALTALEGRSAADWMGDDFRPIRARSVCAECVRRVMQGRRAFATAEEQARVVEATDWSRRRDHRRRAREQRA